MRIATVFLFLASSTAASAHDLGSPERPVRANMPYGEVEYLMRLRCPDQSEPAFERVGSFGRGPYGNILDGYSLTCGTAESMVYIDMYHQGYRELEAIPGYSVLPEIPARVASGCPPQVEGHKPGTYIFRPLEVLKGPIPAVDLAQPIKIGSEGRAYAKFTIDEEGAVIEKSIDIVYVSDESLRAPTSSHLKKLRFTPAMHHEGCSVPFKAELGVDYE